MSCLYIETSALLKLYFEEPGSSPMRALAASELGTFAVSSFTIVEFRAVIRARQRARTLNPAQAEAALAHLRRRVEHHWVRQPVNEVIFDRADVFLDRYTLRAPDALQLAACITLSQTEPVQFVCSEQRLLAAARREGIAAWDPASGLE